MIIAGKGSNIEADHLDTEPGISTNRYSENSQSQITTGQQLQKPLVLLTDILVLHINACLLFLIMGLFSGQRIKAGLAGV